MITIQQVASNEDVRLNDGVLVGGRAVVDLAMRVALMNEVIDVGFRKLVQHSVEDGTTGAGGMLRSEERRKALSYMGIDRREIGIR